MRKYEICVIINPDVDDRQVNTLIEKSLAGFKTDGGTVEAVEVAGRRRLAYDIQKKAEGIYVFLKLTATPAVVKELDRHFTLNEQIMRTKVFRDDLNKRTPLAPRTPVDAKPEGKPAKAEGKPKPAPKADK